MSHHFAMPPAGARRLVTRSDFDGLVCAAILKELNLIDEIKFVHPKDMQDGVIEIITAYSQASPASGWRIDPSTRSGEKVGTSAPPPTPGANRRCFRHEGQTLVLCRMTARQCGQVRVAPAGLLRRVVTRPGASPT